MKSYRIINVILVVMMAFFTISSCKKDKDNTGTTSNSADVSDVSDYAMADAAFNDVANIADEGATGSLESYRGAQPEKILTTCATVSLDTMANPHRITIDFGATDCLCKDGNYRRGIIYVDFTGHYMDSASSHTISFNNYYVNFNKLEGTKTVTNNGRNANGNISFSISINGSIIWDAQYGGGTSTHVSNRTREWVAGENTFAFHDDVYLISGNSSGTNRNGGTYTLTTITPLRKHVDWKDFTEGIVDFTPSGKPTRRIDYSYLNSAKDHLARVTINGYSFTITLR